MELTKTIDSDTAQASCGFLVDDTKIAYISQPMLVFGWSIGEGNYTRPKGEIINCEASIPLLTNETISSDTDYDYQTLAEGKLPKHGMKAVTLKGVMTPNAQGNYFGVISDTGWQYLTYSPTSNVNTFYARCNVDLNQNLEIMRNATFTAVHITVNAVELY